MAINNQPTIEPRTVTGIFTKYIAKTLPLAFDESMSYYECLCALLEYINEDIVPDINNVNDGLSELQTLYLELQDYVNNYFENLDVQEEINNKLDSMVEDGTLTNLIKDYVDPIYQAYENEINEDIENQNTTITNFQSSVNNTISDFNSRLAGVTSGNPLAASSTDDMTDTTRIYVNTTNGKWYYYDGDSWEIGGTYQSTVNTSLVDNIHYNLKPFNKLLDDTLLNVNWENKSIWPGSGGTPETGTNLKRLSFITPIKLTYDLYLKININYQFSVNFFNDDATLITSGIDFANTNYIIVKIPANTYFTLTLKRVDDANIDLSEYVNIYSIEYEEIKNIYSDKKYYRENGNIIDYSLFENINGYASNGTILYTNDHKRLMVRTPQIVYKPTRLKANDGYKFTIMYLNENDFTKCILDIGWMNETVIMPNKHFMLKMAKNTDTEDITLEEKYNLYINNNNYDTIVKSIGHRGYSAIAPENTLISYKLAKQFGFEYGETDIAFTSDNIPVLLHDETINRTARNEDGTTISSTINIADITYEDSQDYDFGIWKSTLYAGTKIPKFDDFIKLCKSIGLKPYIELKYNIEYTNEQFAILMNIVKKYGMQDNVTWISFSIDQLTAINNLYNKSKLGLVTWGMTATNISDVIALQANNSNIIFIDEKIEDLTDANVTSLKENNIPLEVWTIDSKDTINSMNNYITGVTSNKLLANEVLFDSQID